MQRGEAGKYESTTIGGEQVRAFVPLPLPPHPALALDGSQQRTLEAATLALGRLDAISTLLPDERHLPLRLCAQGGSALFTD